MEYLVFPRLEEREESVYIYKGGGEKMRTRLRHNIVFKWLTNVQSNRSEQLGAQIFFKLNGKGETLVLRKIKDKLMRKT